MPNGVVGVPINRIDRAGEKLRGIMQRCTDWHPWMLPLKMVCLATGFALLRFSPLRRYRPRLQTIQQFELAGGPLDSTLNAIVFYRGLFEPVLSSVIQSTVSEGDCCVDAGANVGYFTLLLAHFAGPSGAVISIEPVPRNVQRLQRNVELNNLAERVRTVAAACSDAPGTVNFFVNRVNDMHCRLTVPGRLEWDHWLMGGERAWRPISVPTTTLLEAMGSLANRVSFIKLDIEGAEHLVVGDILRHCIHPNLKVALEAKTPHIRATLCGFEAAGFYIYDLQNTYGWLASRQHVRLKQVSYEDVYRRRHMVDVLLTRQRLPLE